MSPSGKTSTASYSPPSGQDVRSAKTRAKLIEAAIDEFGAVGYEAASTRTLTQRANVNLAAIPYHFGGKRELYLAAARQIADYAQCRLEEASNLLIELDSEDPLTRVESAFLHLLHIILDDKEPRSWTSFLARCTFENDDAFAMIYDDALEPFQQNVSEVAKNISPRTMDPNAVRLRVSTIITTIISFRLLRGFVLRAMGQKQIRHKDAQQIEAIIKDLIRSNFLPPRAAVRSRH
ncbi:CerR family C-terminal domain-containing protein [Hyphomicrobium sp. DY-1]|uniref:CerR family C-terminal domain-containing protein n=1 Tax=Hyphomicrobium sp. DY-1 TaxID=3075650 RepID=UPI0039C227E4